LHHAGRAPIFKERGSFMAETMGKLRRTQYCGEVSMALAGQEMTVCGSIARSRDKGGIIFADLRDTTGILQLVFDEDTPKEVFSKAETLRSEYVVICRGTLRERAAKTDKIATGDVELYVSELRILSDAETPPFEIRDEVQVKDELRLKYRYLDLRRPVMHEPIVLRSKICQIVRNYFCDHHFTEIETPTLIKSTPEGARDYVVPSRVQPGHFYALPQSPQQYKQLLMLSGFDRYFQIARCYRDEDLRADRQPEFTQIDEEMSFVDENDIMTLNEGLIKTLWKQMLDIDVPTPFTRMPWDEAMDRFGSDKPDTRFGLELHDVTALFAHTEFAPFKATVEAGGTIRALNAKGLAETLTRKTIDKLTETAKTYGAKGMAYTRMTAEGISSSFEKNLTDAEKEALHAALGAETGDVLLLVSDAKRVTACTALGQVRLDIGRRCGLIDPDKFNFLWVVNFPLFEYSEEEGRWMAMHHPFTLPTDDSLDKVETDQGACYARAYDIVLNGVEMGGGSMRINNPELQDRMFHALEISEERARENFGFLMDAYRYGAPPHGGMAYGLDRLVMLMLKKDSIRDVIAFPKVQNASELMSGAPAELEPKQYRELSIAYVPQEKA
jgi:aspartyl-tRNA synthetase